MKVVYTMAAGAKIHIDLRGNFFFGLDLIERCHSFATGRLMETVGSFSAKCLIY
jgi:hypothetical protein